MGLVLLNFPDVSCAFVSDHVAAHKIEQKYNLTLFVFRAYK